MGLNIAIDASRTTAKRITGTELYALALIREIIRQNTHHRITLYFRAAPAPDLFPESPLVTYKVIPFRRIWSHLRFSAQLWRDHPDVTFVPAHTLPFIFPGKAVVTVHDLGYKYFPEAHPFTQRLYLDVTTRFSAWRANQILADSQATADDLTRFYGTSPTKIEVVYPGVEAPDIQNQSTIKEKYHLPDRYFLFIGTLQPRKNIARIVKAYQLYRNATDHPAELVLAGGKGWLFDEAWVQGIEGVHLIGYIDDADKGALMADAVCLVFPTLFEGFGFPVIESMLCGTPVITSTTSSLPELAGDAALLVNPMDINAISNAMTQIETDEHLRNQLIQLGTEQAKQFNWEHAAARTLIILERAAIR
ncbi:MAG: glycosyltransferase family 1 protein [Aggregatilineales bacterium]